MSRIFDALQGTRNDAAELLPGLIPNESAPIGRDLTRSKAMTGVAPAALEERVEPQAPATAPAAASMPVIRRLPLAVLSSAPLLPFEDPREPASEQYRIARTRISHHPKKPRMLVVSSGSPGDGKTLTAINLAGVLSLKGDSNVLLIDADFRRSSVHAALGLPQTPGLAEIITGGCAFEDAVVQAEQYPNLNILVNGELGNLNPSELLDSERWRALCRMVRTRYAHIIIDSPPCAPVADFDLIQMAADATVLVVRPDYSKRSACLAAIKAVPQGKLLGVIVNCAENWIFSRDDTYGYAGSPVKARD